MGGVGLGKSHLAVALGHTACLAGHSVLFTTAVEHHQHFDRRPSQPPPQSRTEEVRGSEHFDRHEVGYLPIDKVGANLLFQVISQRYERGSLILTTNQSYKYWSQMFNNDSSLTSALLDRLLHHSETVVIEGRSYRAKDQIEPI